MPPGFFWESCVTQSFFFLLGTAVFATVTAFSSGPSYGYSNPMGYQTSDFRLLWTIPPNPQHPSPP